MGLGHARSDAISTTMCNPPVLGCPAPPTPCQPPAARYPGWLSFVGVHSTDVGGSRVLVRLSWVRFSRGGLGVGARFQFPPSGLCGGAHGAWQVWCRAGYGLGVQHAGSDAISTTTSNPLPLGCPAPHVSLLPPVTLVDFRRRAPVSPGGSCVRVLPRLRHLCPSPPNYLFRV